MCKKRKNMLRRVRFELTPFRTTDLGDRPKRSALDHSAIFPLLDSGPRLCTACMAIRNGILNFGLDTEGYPCNHCACMIRESQYPGFHYMWIPFPNGCVSWLMYRMFNHGSFDESSTQCCAERMLSGNSRLWECKIIYLVVDVARFVAALYCLSDNCGLGFQLSMVRKSRSLGVLGTMDCQWSE